MKHFIFCRHCQSEYNARINQKFNSELTVKGVEQAQRLGELLKNSFDLSEFDCLISPYTRCLQTAFALTKFTNFKNLIVNVHLGEMANEFHVKNNNYFVYPRSGLYKMFDWRGHNPSFNYRYSEKDQNSILVNLLCEMTGKKFMVSHRPIIEFSIRLLTGKNIEIENAGIIEVIDNKIAFHDKCTIKD